jgi:NAD(P)H-hydrate epimerase
MRYNTAVPQTVLTRTQVRRLDELAQSRYGLPGIILMENAGRGAAEIIDRQFGPCGQALIACGTGNNGGDGLVIARHLHNAAWSVRVLIAGDPKSMSPDCASNYRVVEAVEIPLVRQADQTPASPFDCVTQDTVLVDALLGTGFQGQVHPVMKALIDRLNLLPKKAMVAIDVPSGLDCDTGLPGGTAIKADLTITFAALKPGLLTESGRSFCGRCQVTGIGAPHRLLDEVANLDEIR